MDKNLLLETASQLKQVSEKTAYEYHQKSDQLITKINTILLNRPDIENLAGIGDSIKRSTGDDLMAQKIHEMCEMLVEHVKKTQEKG